MDKNANYFRLGCFVAVAIAAIIIGISLLLGPEFFRSKAKLETYFQFSISGLEVGSPVKFRGIQVGQVEEILLSTEAYPQSAQQILSETQAVAVVRMKIDLSNDRVKEQLSDYITHGLRIQTQLAGITGGLYLSMDFLDPDKYPADRIKFNWKPKYTFVPSAPSLSNEIVENIKEFLANLDSLNVGENLKETVPVLQSLVRNLDRIAGGLNPETFNKLGVSLSTLLNNTDQKISQVDVEQLNKLIAQIDASAKSVQNFTQKSDINKLVSSLNSLSQNLSTVLRGNRYDLNETINNFNQVSENLKQLIDSIPTQPIDLLKGPAPESGNPLNARK